MLINIPEQKRCSECPFNASEGSSECLLAEAMGYYLSACPYSNNRDKHATTNLRPDKCPFNKKMTNKYELKISDYDESLHEFMKRLSRW